MTVPDLAGLPLQIRPLEAAAVERLVNGCFPVEQGASFFDDFPAWTSEGALWLGACDEKGFVGAAAGALPGEWLLGADGGSITIVRIGGVVTHERWRSRGLASDLVGALVGHATGAGAEACVLWGEDSPLYRRLGFEPLGRQLRIPLSALVSEVDRASAVLRIEEGFSGDVFLAMNESRREWGGVLLSAADGELIPKHRHTRWARVLDGQGRLAGYGAFGKGIDLGLQLHEWGGTREAIRAVGRWALAIDPRAEIMGSQPRLESAFGELPRESLVEPLCLARVPDPALRSRLGARERQLWFWGLDGA